MAREVARPANCLSSNSCLSLDGGEGCCGALFRMSGKEPFRSLDPEQRAKRLTRQREQLAHVSEWLRYRSLTQKHIANILGVSDGVVSRYISGETMMPAGALREIALLLEIGEGDLVRPPPGDALGPIMEETITQMERLGRDQWLKLLEIAKGMRGKSD